MSSSALSRSNSSIKGSLGRSLWAVGMGQLMDGWAKLHAWPPVLSPSVTVQAGCVQAEYVSIPLQQLALSLPGWVGPRRHVHEPGCHIGGHGHSERPRASPVMPILRLAKDRRMGCFCNGGHLWGHKLWLIKGVGLQAHTGTNLSIERGYEITIDTQECTPQCDRLHPCIPLQAPLHLA